MGGRTVLEQLVYQLSADVTQLTKQNARALEIVKGGTKKIQDHMDRAGMGLWSKFLGEPPDMGAALEKTFSRARLGVLEEGGAKIGLFGSALEKLGPIGIGVAATMAGVAIGIEQVSKAAEQITQLAIRSEKLDIGTDQLQQLDAQAHVADISTQKLDEGLAGLAETLGKLQAGIRIKRIQPWLEQLGISQEDIDKAKNAADMVDLLSAKLDGYGGSEKRAILAGLGVTADLIPLLDMEKSKRDEINAAIAEYKIPPQMVQSIKDQTEALNLQHEVLDAKLKKDWAELIPIVDALKSAWMGVEGAIADAAVAATTKAPKKVESLAPGIFKWVGEAVAGPAGGAIGGGFDMALGPSQPAGAAAATAAKQGPGSKAREHAEATLTSQLQSETAALIDHHQHLVEINAKIASYIKGMDSLSGGGVVIPKLANGQYDESKLTADQRANIGALRAHANQEDAAGQNKKGIAIDKEDVAAIHQATMKYLEAQIKNTADLDKLHTLNVLKINQTADDTKKELGDKLRGGQLSKGAYQTATATNEDTRQQDLQNEQADDAIARRKKSQDTEDQQTRLDIAMLTARAVLAKNAQGRADLEMQAFQKQQQMEAADDDVSLKDQVATKQISSEKAAQLAWERMQTQELQRDAKQKELDDKAEATKEGIAKDSAALAARIATAQAALAANIEARSSLERQALVDRQAKELADQKKKVADGDADATSVPKLEKAQGLELQGFDKSHETPWATWVTEGQAAAANVGSAIQTQAVKAIDGFNSGIADAIVNGKNLGATMTAIFKDMEKSLIEYLLKQAEIALLPGSGSAQSNPSSGGGVGSIFSAIGSLFFGGFHASGGLLSGPGGPRSDNMLIAASPGEYVVNAKQTAKNRPLLEMINRGLHGTPKFADGGLIGLAGSSSGITGSGLNLVSGGITDATAMVPGAAVIHQHFTLHAPGSMMFPEFVDQVNGSIRQMGSVAANAGAQGGHQLTMTALGRARRNRLG